MEANKSEGNDKPAEKLDMDDSFPEELQEEFDAALDELDAELEDLDDDEDEFDEDEEFDDLDPDSGDVPSEESE